MSYKKWISRTVDRFFAAYLEPLAHHQNVVTYSITLVNIHLNWLNWLHFFILEGGLLIVLIDCMIFLSPFLDVTRCLFVGNVFPCTTRLWNSLLISCFPLNYDLNGFKSRINRHLLTVGSF